MDPYQPQQPDEGYSEAPLSGAVSGPFLTKAAADRASSELSPMLVRQLGSLSLASKIQLTESLLDSLPTSIIVQIVQKLSPRLYIDFVHYLPAEICLKILGYLDPLSLITVARSCRAWYGLALDRKLWERLYYLEGWKIVDAELHAWEEKMNRDQPVPSEGGHAFKKRALSSSRRHDPDHVMLDADRSNTAEFAEPRTAETTTSSLFGEPMSMSTEVKGKGKERVLPASPPSIITTPPTAVGSVGMLTAPRNTLPKSTLCMWDPATDRYRVSWKYLYSLRRRLEANWELGRFTNFQFPHPDHPEEAHGEYIYTIQFNSEYLVSGSRDRSIRIWNMHTRRLIRKPLVGHRGSVLCLQFDSDPEEDLIVSGSSDSNVILWRFSTGEILQRLSRAHRDPVLNVKFDKRILVTCSKDKTIKIFNRTALRPGDLGYGDVAVQPVPVHLKDYGYTGLDQLPIKPPYTLIGSLEGHSAAVNAVQIYDREVVSASGDRNVKIWNWPNQTCMRTFLGHSKGIACVQYDGRRIVSGSSDNEVKVFDRQSGVEVASLRAHSSLVRTVQAGFGDLPYSADEDAKAAARIDQRYLEAMQNGTLPMSTMRHRRRGEPRASNAGGSHTDDIMFTGAKLPPGGGGGKYGRIVSGSYDTTIIIWRRDKEGVWRAQHRLIQEEATAAAVAAAAAAKRVAASSSRSRSRRANSSGSGSGSGSGNGSNGNSSSSMLHPTAGPPSLTPMQMQQLQELQQQQQLQQAQQARLAQQIQLATAGSAGPEATAAMIASAMAAARQQEHAHTHTHAHAHTHAHTHSQQQAQAQQAQQAQQPQPEQSQQQPITPQTFAVLATVLDEVIPQGVPALQQALQTYPALLSMSMQEPLQAAIDRHPSPFVRSQLRQAVSSALVRHQIAQSRAMQESVPASGSGTGSGSRPATAPGGMPPVYDAPPSSSSAVDAASIFGASPTAPAAVHAPSVTPAVLAHPAGQPPHQPATTVPGAVPVPPVMPGEGMGGGGAPPAPGVAAAAAAGPPRPPPAAAAAAAPAPTPTQAPHDPMAAAIAPNQSHLQAAAQAAAAAAADGVSSPRVFKLQFDARQIICCSQTATIVGWDFCNGDAELEAAVRFFATVD